jgi:hypothetical protein
LNSHANAGEVRELLAGYRSYSAVGPIWRPRSSNSDAKGIPCRSRISRMSGLRAMSTSMSMGSITSMSRKSGDGTDYGHCVSQGWLSLSAKNFSITTGKPVGIRAKSSLFPFDHALCPDSTALSLRCNPSVCSTLRRKWFLRTFLPLGPLCEFHPAQRADFLPIFAPERSYLARKSPFARLGPHRCYPYLPLGTRWR